MHQSNEAMQCNERFMAQEGIDALAELWEETGTFRKKGEKILAFFFSS